MKLFRAGRTGHKTGLRPQRAFTQFFMNGTNVDQIKMADRENCNGAAMSTITLRSIQLHNACKAALAASDGEVSAGTKVESDGNFLERAHQRQRQVACARWENEGGAPFGRVELRPGLSTPLQRARKTKLPTHEI